MSDCPIEELPKNLIYYTSTEISRRGQTRFDIDTHFLIRLLTVLFNLNYQLRVLFFMTISPQL
jgi:hypothetical protein